VSLRDQIAAAKDAPIEVMEVPEWKLTIELRGMSAGERVSMTTESFDANTNQPNLRALYPRVLIACVFDPKTGERVFQEGDSEMILSKAGTVVDRIAIAALQLSSADQNALTEAGKNLLGNQSAVSPSS